LHQDQLSLVIYPADRDFKKLVELQLFWQTLVQFTLQVNQARIKVLKIWKCHFSHLSMYH
jgi:hypothetical protein